MVPRQHAAPIAGFETPSAPPRRASGRADGEAGNNSRTAVVVLAFLLGFAACFMVLKSPAGVDEVSGPRAPVPLVQNVVPAP